MWMTVSGSSSASSIFGTGGEHKILEMSGGARSCDGKGHS